MITPWVLPERWKTGKSNHDLHFRRAVSLTQTCLITFQVYCIVSCCTSCSCSTHWNVLHWVRDTHPRKDIISPEFILYAKTQQWLSLSLRLDKKKWSKSHCSEIANICVRLWHQYGGKCAWHYSDVIALWTLWLSCRMSITKYMKLACLRHTVYISYFQWPFTLYHLLL